MILHRMGTAFWVTWCGKVRFKCRFPIWITLAFWVGFLQVYILPTCRLNFLFSEQVTPCSLDVIHSAEVKCTSCLAGSTCFENINKNSYTWLQLWLLPLAFSMRQRMRIFWMLSCGWKRSCWSGQQGDLLLPSNKYWLASVLCRGLRDCVPDYSCTRAFWSFSSGQQPGSMGCGGSDESRWPSTF